MKSANAMVPAQAGRQVVPFRLPAARRREELAFLPAALEIVETPPSPIGRAITAAIVLLAAAALVWAWWGTIDIVASATGKVVPSGRTKVVQPLEAGVVRHMVVNDLPLGRSVEEILRTIDALQHFETHGEVCPADWAAGKEAMKATQEGVSGYLAKR